MLNYLLFILIFRRIIPENKAMDICFPFWSGKTRVHYMYGSCIKIALYIKMKMPENIGDELALWKIFFVFELLYQNQKLIVATYMDTK